MIGCWCCGQNVYLLHSKVVTAFRTEKGSGLGVPSKEKNLLFSVPWGDSIARGNSTFSHLPVWGQFWGQKALGIHYWKNQQQAYFLLQVFFWPSSGTWRESFFESCDHVPNSRHCIPLLFRLVKITKWFLITTIQNKGLRTKQVLNCLWALPVRRGRLRDSAWWGGRS